MSSPAPEANARPDTAGGPKAAVAAAGRLSIEVTPGGAFAASSLAVALLALAFSWGRYVGLESAEAARQSGGANQAATVTLEEVQRRLAMSFETIAVDRGGALNDR